MNATSTLTDGTRLSFYVEDGDILAVYERQDADGWTDRVMTYALMGEHSEADQAYVLELAPYVDGSDPNLDRQVERIVAILEARTPELTTYPLECGHTADVPGPQGVTSGRAWCPDCNESSAVDTTPELRRYKVTTIAYVDAIDEYDACDRESVGEGNYELEAFYAELADE